MLMHHSGRNGICDAPMPAIASITTSRKRIPDPLSFQEGRKPHASSGQRRTRAIQNITTINSRPATVSRLTFVAVGLGDPEIDPSRQFYGARSALSWVHQLELHRAADR